MQLKPKLHRRLSNTHWRKKFLSTGIILLYLVNSIFIPEAKGLAPWTSIENPEVRREIFTAFYNDQIEWAYPGSQEETRLQEYNNAMQTDAKGILIETGHVIITSSIKHNHLRVAKIIVHENVEAFMQALKIYDPYRYNGLKRLFLENPGTEHIRQLYYNLCHKGKDPSHKDPDLIINDMIAKALEIKFIRENRLLSEMDYDSYEERAREARFYNAIKKEIDNNRDNYFRDGLDISYEAAAFKKNMIDRFIKEGHIFYVTAREEALKFDQETEEIEDTEDNVKPTHLKLVKAPKKEPIEEKGSLFTIIDEQPLKRKRKPLAESYGTPAFTLIDSPDIRKKREQVLDNYLPFLGKSILQGNEDDIQEALGIFENMIIARNFDSDIFIKDLEKRFDLKNESLEQIHLNLAIYKIFSILPAKCITWPLAAELSAFLDYKGPFKEQVFKTAKDFFLSIPDEKVFKEKSGSKDAFEDIYKYSDMKDILDSYFRDFNDLKMLTALGETKLGVLVQLNDKDSASARETFILSNLRLVIFVAKRFNKKKKYNMKELIAEGNIALIRAVDGFKPQKKNRFSTYAVKVIHDHIKRHKYSSLDGVMFKAYRQEHISGFIRKCFNKGINPFTTLLSDREIAEKIGMQASLVEQYKRRLKMYKGTKSLAGSINPSSKSEREYFIGEDSGLYGKIDDERVFSKFRDELMRRLDSYEANLESGLKKRDPELMNDIIRTRIFPGKAGKEGAPKAHIARAYIVSAGKVDKFEKTAYEIINQVLSLPQFAAIKRSFKWYYGRGKNNDLYKDFEKAVYTKIEELMEEKRQKALNMHERLLTILFDRILPQKTGKKPRPLQEIADKQNPPVSRERISQNERKLEEILDAVLAVPEFAELREKFLYPSGKSSLGDCLLHIFENWGFGAFNKERLYAYKDFIQSPTVDTLIKELKKIKLILSVKGKTKIYRLNPIIKGKTHEKTIELIRRIREIEVDTGKRKVLALEFSRIPRGHHEEIIEKMSEILEEEHFYEKFKDDNRIIWAKPGTEEELLLKRNENASALLVSAGKFIIPYTLKDNPVMVMRAVIHEEVEAFMQVLKDTDKYRYNGLKELFLNSHDRDIKKIRRYYYDLCHDGNIPDYPNADFLINDMISKILEIKFFAENGFLRKSGYASEEEKIKETKLYFKAVKVIKQFKHNYFMDGLNTSPEDSKDRKREIEKALEKGQRFYLSAQKSAVKTEESPGYVVFADWDEPRIRLLKTPSDDEEIKKKIIKWYKTGTGLDPGDSLVVSLNLKKPKIFQHRGQRITIDALAPNGDIDNAEIVFVAEEDINHGLVLNAYLLEDYQYKIKVPLMTFMYNHVSRKAQRADLAALDIISYAYGLKPIVTQRRVFRAELKNGKKNIVRIKVFDTHNDKYTLLTLNLSSNETYADSNVIVLLENDENHGQVINVYSERDFMNVNDSVPLGTWKFYDGVKPKGSELVRAVKVDLGCMDIATAANGKPLKMTGRAAIVKVYKEKGCGVIRISSREYENPSKFWIPEEYMKSPFPLDRAVMRVEEDINQGQTINIYSENDLKNLNKATPIITYKYFSQTDVERKIVKEDYNIYKPVDLNVLDIKAYAAGDTNIKPRKGMVDKTHGWIVRYKNGDIRFFVGKGLSRGEHKSFSLYEEMRNIKDFKKTYASVKEDKDYGSYVEIFDDERVLARYYYFDKKYGCRLVDFNKLSLMDYILGRRNKDGNEIVPRLKQFEAKVHANRNTFVLSCIGRERIDTVRMHHPDGKTPHLDGKRVIVNIVKDKKYGYLFQVHDKKLYEADKLRKPDIVLIRNKYFRTLVPLSREKLYKAKEFMDKKYFGKAYNILQGYLEQDESSSDREANRCLILSRRRFKDDFLRGLKQNRFIRRTSDLNLSLQILGEFIFKNDDENRDLGINAVKKYLRACSDKDLRIFFREIERLIDFNKDTVEQVYLNIALYRVLKFLPAGKMSHTFLRKAARFLDYEGKNSEIIFEEAEKFFRSIPYDICYDARGELTYFGQIKFGVLLRLGDRNIRERLIIEHRTFAETYAYNKIWKLYPAITKRFELDDIKEYAVEGLIIGIDTFEPQRPDSNFYVHCLWKIRQNISRRTKNEGNVIRIPVHRIERITQLRREFDLENTDDEDIAEKTGLSKKQLKGIRYANRAGNHVSMDSSNSDDPDVRNLLNILPSGDTSLLEFEKDDMYRTFVRKVAERITAYGKRLEKQSMTITRDKAKKIHKTIVLKKILPAFAGRDIRIKKQKPLYLDSFTDTKLGEMFNVSGGTITRYIRKIRPIVESVLDRPEFKEVKDDFERYYMAGEKKHELSSVYNYFVKEVMKIVFETETKKFPKINPSLEVLENGKIILARRILPPLRVKNGMELKDLEEMLGIPRQRAKLLPPLRGKKSMRFEDFEDILGVTKSRVEQIEALMYKEIINPILEDPEFEEYKAYLSKGSPGDCLSDIYKYFVFRPFNKKEELYPLREKYKDGKPTGKLYAKSTVDLEVRILKNLNILIMIESGKYQLNPVLEGETPADTARNIASVYNMQFKIGKKEMPLERSNIPKDNFQAVKALTCMTLADICRKKQTETMPIKQKYQINIWKGYASPGQEAVLTRIRRMAEKSAYNVRFYEMDELVNKACEQGNDNSVTILPCNRTRWYHQKELIENSAQVLYMDIKEGHLNPNDFVPLNAIINTGIAYLNGNDRAFNNLYRILGEKGDDIGITIADLKNNPQKAKDYIFTILPIHVKDVNDFKELNKRLEAFLSSA